MYFKLYMCHIQNGLVCPGGIENQSTHMAHQKIWEENSFTSQQMGMLTLKKKRTEWFASKD